MFLTNIEVLYENNRAQKARIGSTDYYIAKMELEELVNSVGLAIELPEWKDMTPDEKMQREQVLIG